MRRKWWGRWRSQIQSAPFGARCGSVDSRRVGMNFTNWPGCRLLIRWARLQASVEGRCRTQCRWLRRDMWWMRLIRRGRSSCLGRQWLILWIWSWFFGLWYPWQCAVKGTSNAVQKPFALMRRWWSDGCSVCSSIVRGWRHWCIAATLLYRCIASVYVSTVHTGVWAERGTIRKAYASAMHTFDESRNWWACGDPKKTTWRVKSRAGVARLWNRPWARSISDATTKPCWCRGSLHLAVSRALFLWPWGMFEQIRCMRTNRWKCYWRACAEATDDAAAYVPQVENRLTTV